MGVRLGTARVREIRRRLEAVVALGTRRLLREVGRVIGKGEVLLEVRLAAQPRVVDREELEAHVEELQRRVLFHLLHFLNEEQGLGGDLLEASVVAQGDALSEVHVLGDALGGTRLRFGEP